MKISYLFQAIEACIYVSLCKLTGKKLKTSILTFVSHKAVLRTGALDSLISIGYQTAIRANTEIHADGGQIIIGNCCFINRNCMIVSHERIVIKNGVTIGPNVCIYDHDHDGHGGYETSVVTIGENTWIGAGSILLKGITVGKNCVIGAGTLLTKDIPDDTVVYQPRSTKYVERGK